MPRIVRAPIVEHDLLEIWDYIALDDMDAADRVLDRIGEVVQKLADAPGMGVARDDLSPGIRCFPVGNNLIFYRVTDDGIEVARIVSGVRDLPRLF